MGIPQHFLQFGVYGLLVLATKGTCTLKIIKQSNITCFPNFSAQEIARDIPSNLNNGLERPAHATASPWDRVESVGFVVMLVVRMGGHWRLPYVFRISSVFTYTPILTNSWYNNSKRIDRQSQ